LVLDFIKQVFKPDYLLTYINEILEINRIESNNIEIENINFNIRELLLNIQNSSSPGTYISYIPIRFGLDYQLKNRKISFFSNISNYILATDKEPINEQKSFYSNLDLGIRIKTGKHWSLSLSSPITLLPMYYNEGITILTNPPSPEYDIWVENVGLMFGLKYRFD